MVECRHQADRGARNGSDSVPVACAPRSSLGPDWSPSELKPGACSGPGPVSTQGDRACFSGIYLRAPLTPGLGLELASALQAPGPPEPPLLSSASVCPQWLWLLPGPESTSHGDVLGSSFSPQRSASTSHQGSACTCYSSKTQGFISHVGSFGWFLVGAGGSRGNECDGLHFIDEETGF